MVPPTDPIAADLALAAKLRDAGKLRPAQLDALAEQEVGTADRIRRAWAQRKADKLEQIVTRVRTGGTSRLKAHSGQKENRVAHTRRAQKLARQQRQKTRGHR